MKFDGIYDDNIKTSMDLLRYLLTPKANELSTADLRTVFKAINLVDLTYRDDARGMLIAIQSSKRPGYETAGVIYLRLRELKTTGLTDEDRTREAVDLVRCMVEKPHPTLKDHVLPVVTGMYHYLAYRQPDLAQSFVDGLIYSANNREIKFGMPEALMTKPTAQHVDTKPFFAALHHAIERQGDVKDWLKEHIPARSRIRAAEISGFSECFEILSKKRKGHLLENQLGL